MVNGLARVVQNMQGGVRLGLSLEPGLQPTRTDPDRLEEAILTLVRNACEAMPHGGQLTIQTRERPTRTGLHRWPPGSPARPLRPAGRFGYRRGDGPGSDQPYIRAVQYQRGGRGERAGIGGSLRLGQAVRRRHRSTEPAGQGNDLSPLFAEGRRLSFGTTHPRHSFRYFSFALPTLREYPMSITCPNCGDDSLSTSFLAPRLFVRNAALRFLSGLLRCLHRRLRRPRHLCLLRMRSRRRRSVPLMSVPRSPDTEVA